MAVRNFAHHAKPLEAAKNFAHHAKFRMVCEIFLCTDSVRFLSPDILCNLLFSPCNQPMIVVSIPSSHAGDLGLILDNDAI